MALAIARGMETRLPMVAGDLAGDCSLSALRTEHSNLRSLRIEQLRPTIGL
jgi:hypothetical protein